VNALALTYLRIVLSRWRLVLAIVLACTASAWAISVFYLATKPKFEAAARLNIVPTAEELGYATRFVRGSTFDGGSVLLGTYAEFARTRPIVEPIVDRFIAENAAAAGKTPAQWIAANTGPPGFSPGRILAILNYGEAPSVSLREEIVEELLEKTTIETVEGTYLIRLAVEWDDPRAAAWFANALADAIIARADRTSRKSGQELAGTIAARLADKRAELAATLRQSRDRKADAGVVDFDRQKTALLEARITEQAQLTTERANLDAAQGQVAGLRRQAGGKLSAAQQVVEQTLAVEGPRAAGLADSVRTREARIAQIDRQIAALGPQEDRIKSLDERAAQLQQEVTALTERVGFAQTENLANNPRIQLIERATPPLTRSSPKVFFNTLLGAVAGCALAACALLLLGPAPVRRRPEAEVHEPQAVLGAPAADAPPIAMAETGGTWRAIAPAHDPDLVYPDALPRPARDSYDTREVAALAPPLARWLGAALADARPLFVAGAGPDADAQALAQLVYAQLRDGDRAVAVVDGTRAGARWDAGDAKPFVYLGGLSGSARADALARVPADAWLAVATSPAAPADWRAHADAELPRAHVVRFDR
jgi:uncharacterized protein involved in exopolysaccharide biosynthesis